MQDNLGALAVDLAPAQLDRLEQASAIDLGFPHAVLASDHISNVTTGGLQIESRL